MARTFLSALDVCRGAFLHRIENGEEVKYFPLASSILDCHPSNSGGSRSLQGDANNNMYLMAVKTQGGCDLVEEFVAADIYPLGGG